MTFQDKKELYSKIAIPYYGISGNKFYKVQSLLCKVTMAIRLKKMDNNISSYDILNKIFIGRNDIEREIAENLCVHCDHQLSVPGTEFDKYDTVTIKDAQAEIIKILSDYLPF